MIAMKTDCGVFRKKYFLCLVGLIYYGIKKTKKKLRCCFKLYAFVLFSECSSAEYTVALNEAFRFRAQKLITSSTSRLIAWTGNLIFTSFNVINILYSSTSWRYALMVLAKLYNNTDSSNRVFCRSHDSLGDSWIAVCLWWNDSLHVDSVKYWV